MSILREIRNGQYDDLLEEMASEIFRRRKVLGRMRFAQMPIGTKVRFISTIKPSYLAGMQATLVGRKVSKLIVKLDQPVGRFGGELRCSPSLVEPVDQDIIDQPGMMKRVNT